MIPAFSLHQPDSLDGACFLLSKYADEAKILAGGSELILLLKLGLISPHHLIDIKKIQSLHCLDFDTKSQELSVGALATHRMLETSQNVNNHFPLLARMERTLANVRVRGVGTLGGNLCFAEPQADPGALLLAYEAKVNVESTRGKRTINVSDFFVDYYRTVLHEDEIVTEIVVPKPPSNSVGIYQRFCPGERPIATVALIVGWKDGKAAHVRLGLGCAGPKPIRALELERSLIGRSANEVLAASAACGESAAALCDPLEDTWGSKKYKRQIVKTLTMRSFTELCNKELIDG